MNIHPISSPLATKSAPTSNSNESQYAEASETMQLLRTGAQYRRDRMDAADMMTTDAAAAMAGTSRVTINAWIKTGRCIGISHLRRGFKLPVWQFEPLVWPLLHPVAQRLGTSDGWQMLSFFESPAAALKGLSPRAALEQGVPPEKILALATAEGH